MSAATPSPDPAPVTPSPQPAPAHSSATQTAKPQVTATTTRATTTARSTAAAKHKTVKKKNAALRPNKKAAGAKPRTAAASPKPPGSALPSILVPPADTQERSAVSSAFRLVSLSLVGMGVLLLGLAVLDPRFIMPLRLRQPFAEQRGWVAAAGILLLVSTAIAYLLSRSSV